MFKDFDTLKEKDSQYIANTYNRVPLAVVSGENASCKDINGKEYIDFSSGIGVNSLGFAPEKWVEAVTNQLAKLAHMSNLYYTLPQVELAEKLCTLTGMKKVFYANSGAEANEGAIKTARKYSKDKYGENRYEIVTLVNSFHGRTVTTLAATGQEVFHKDFDPFTKGFEYALANDFDDVISKVNDKTCAVMIELIQGEGGVVPLEKEFVKSIEKLCKEKDILLIVDEVQTGVGRTGKFLCTQWYGIEPDIVTLAKGLGGGLPLGAVLFGEKTENTLGFGDHATTFGGNPAVCAGANVVVDTLSPEFLAAVAEKGEYIAQKVKLVPGVSSVMGKGLMVGIELEEGLDNSKIIPKLAEEGVIFLSAKAKLRMLPPLNISYDEIDKGLSCLEKVLSQEAE